MTAFDLESWLINNNVWYAGLSFTPEDRDRIIDLVKSSYSDSEGFWFLGRFFFTMVHMDNRSDCDLSCFTGENRNFAVKIVALRRTEDLIVLEIDPDSVPLGQNEKPFITVVSFKRLSDYIGSARHAAAVGERIPCSLTLTGTPTIVANQPGYGIVKD